MHPRGVTLIELLIAIALLLTLAVIATPVVINTLDERAFESALDSIERQFLLARAEAQLRGEIIEVVAVTAPGSAGTQLTVRLFNDDDAFTEPAVAAFGNGAGWEIDPDADVLAVRDLPRRIEIRLTAPHPASSTEALAASFAEISPDQHPTERADRLLLYMPDGSALLARRFWVVDGDDRQARVEIEPWSGQPRIIRLPPVDLAVPEELDALTPAVVTRAPLESGR